MNELSRSAPIVNNDKNHATLRLSSTQGTTANPALVDLSKLTQRDHLSLIDLSDNVKIQIDVAGELSTQGTKAITGSGTLQITSTSARDLGATNIVLGNNVKIVDASGTVIADSALNLRAEQRRSDADIINAKGNYYTPVANDDVMNIIYDSSVSQYVVNFQNNLLANDSDADGDSLKVTSISITDASKGTISNIDYTNGTADFKFADGIKVATLQYVASDGNGGTDMAEVKLILNKPSMSLSSLDGSNGFKLNGTDTDDLSGYSVSNAGDINGDGFDDVIIGAYNASSSYVIFGKASSYLASINLSSLDGSNGFELNGAGTSVSTLGDVNGDGYDDVIVGIQGGGAGRAYVVFGKASGFSTSMDLSTLDGTDGFRLNGVDSGDNFGYSVSNAGDVNGDGYDDIIVGAYGTDIGLEYNIGETYVVFGKASGFSASMDISTLNGSNGFRLDGVDDSDKFGLSVSSAGDVNGDGFDDVIIGAPGADGLMGESYVVFGKASGFSASIDISTLNGSNGFRIDSTEFHSDLGLSVSSAGDINGDGFDDVIIGASGAHPNGINRAGKSYVIFGKGSSFSASMDLSSIDGTNGFHIDGLDVFGYLGRSVSNAGDFNGDGFDDIIIGTNPSYSNVKAGESYIIFGKKNYTKSFDLSSLNGNNGLRLDGIDSKDGAGRSVSSAGDVNGDGFDDVIIGAPNADPNSKSNAGESYVVFGYDNNNSQSITNMGTSGDDIINGGAVNDTLSGGAGDDIIHGGNGDDKITGGTGDDKLDGGYGNDEFIFNNGDDKDTILDFEKGKDKIDLSSYKIGGAEVDDVNDFAIQQKQNADGSNTGDVIITLAGNDEILIRNADASSFTNDDFIF